MTNFNTIESENFFEFINSVKKENPVLTQEQTLELVEKMRNGDKSAKDKIVMSNFGLIQMIASGCKIPNVCLEDKFYAAMDKFIQMVDEFDPSVCPYLSSYVWLTVRQSVYDAFLVMPATLFKLSSKICKFRGEFEVEYNRKPTLEEISVFTGIPEKKLALKMREIADYNTKSLDAMVRSDDDDGCTGYNFVCDEVNAAPDSEILKNDRIASIRKALNMLNAEERELIILSYDENNVYGRQLSLREIGKIKEVAYQTIANHLKTAKEHLARNLDKFGE